MNKHVLQMRRQALGLSQKAAAETLGVRRQVYARWERGETRIPLGRHAQMASLLQLDKLPEAPQGGLAPRVPRRGHRTRRRYDVGGTVDEVMRLGRHPEQMAREARAACTDPIWDALTKEFPRDTRHELLLLLTFVAYGARLVRTSPYLSGCRMLVMDDDVGEYAGDRTQWALLWEGDREAVLVFGQQRLKAPFN